MGSGLISPRSSAVTGVAIFSPFNPPVVEAIAEDPLLADTKIIAEAWDAAGAYQVGSFATARWAEWNGRYRDDIRRFWRGDPGMIGPTATRLAGSSDLYEATGRKPYHSINFITSHDGFTLNDLSSYNHKHNHANGEDNRDGDNNNYSYNWGYEGATRRRNINRVRRKIVKNKLTTLMLSQGVPMLLSGDECHRTQRGNNNAYCQDNSTSYFDWRLVKRHQELLRFTQALIRFRRQEPAVRREHFLSGELRPGAPLPEVSWYAHTGTYVDWHRDDHSLICVLAAVRPDSLVLPDVADEDAEPPSRNVMMMLHAGNKPREFVVPEACRQFRWRRFVDTAADSPKDIYPDLDGPRLAGEVVWLDAHSTMIFVSEIAK